ncbi:MAG TPA: metalloregulator ArsR/SmtB family transcription factor [Thermopetrobacter sp.]|nr:metalloregulator ArsR/SmtB family transcription factor [Thermopetrobacter sp.]
MSHIVFFQALADETRLRMIVLLADGRELAVGELVAALALSQPKVSRHLAHLREARIVEVRRRAQWVLYRLSDGLEPWQTRTIATIREGLRGRDPFRADAARLPAAGTGAAPPAARRPASPPSGELRGRHGGTPH